MKDEFTQSNHNSTQSRIALHLMVNVFLPAPCLPLYKDIASL
jgi:hypothetical protein